MVLHEDWIMRQISAMVRMIAKIVFKKESAVQVAQDENPGGETDLLHKRLLELIDERRFNEAENILFDRIRADDIHFLAVAADFYEKLAAFDDEMLESADFSRDEIYWGLRDIMAVYGIKI